jgi:hypothetical protein
VDVTLQNECTYAVLDILPERMTFQKKMAEGEGAGGKAAKSAAAAKSKGKIVAKGEIVRNYVSCSFLCEFFSLRIEGIHIFAG